MTRKDWLQILAHADNKDIKSLWHKATIILDPNTVSWLRSPEIGLLPLQARIGNTGDKFLIGDATITRAVVEVIDANQTLVGYAFITGRDKTCAEICAYIDALMQDSVYYLNVLNEILTPLADLTAKKQAAQRKEVEKTKVDFFTMVRGE